jgi:large subunit ribosomal protein L5
MTNFKEHYNQEIRKELKEFFKYENDFQIPKITQVSINIGAGMAKDSEDFLKTAISELTKISGQKPKINKSRKSIAGFKLREGQVVGLSVTLRGARMHDFLERFVSVSLPRIRDFRGVSAKSFDKQGNYSIGIREHTIFPEIKFDSVKETLGMQVNITTTAKTPEEGRKLLELVGFPFAKSMGGKE